MGVGVVGLPRHTDTRMTPLSAGPEVVPGVSEWGFESRRLVECYSVSDLLRVGVGAGTGTGTGAGVGAGDGDRL